MDLTLFFNATWQMYGRCARQASQALMRNWPLIILSVLAYAAVLIAGRFLPAFGLAGRLVLGFFEVAVLTAYFSWLFDLSAARRLSLSGFWRIDWSIFSSVISAAFIIWLIEQLAGMMLKGGALGLARAYFRLVLVVIFNALPEVLYLRRDENLSAFSRAAALCRDNPVEWYFPYLLILSPLFLGGVEYLPFFLSQTQPLMPVLIVFTSLNRVLAQLPAVAIGVVLVNWLMLFRGLLFQELEGGNRRSRMFKARQ